MPDDTKKFYLTTPIYYVNARPHIGHAYTTIVADVIARRHRLLGDDTFFLTGTDEHGQKIARSADAAGIPPLQFANQVSQSFQDLWKRMGITNNAFIRTTDERHKQGVQKLFQTLKDRGQIYLSTYTGQYCVSDEAYVDGPPGIRCPDCGRVTETVSESNYYFKLSAFQLPLLDLIESNTLLITPDSRRNEVLSFLRGNIASPQPGAPQGAELGDPGISTEAPSSPPHPTFAHTAAGAPYVPGALKDLSISRTSFKWGIPVPGDEAHVIYVWLDALANYMTAVGYGSDILEDIAKFEKYWPAELHLVGKEIIRFHCVYWPAFLLAAGLATPKAITAHGWLLFQDSNNQSTKMSKSKGNIVRTETILDTFGEHVYKREFPNSTRQEQDVFASDVLRYFLLREIPFGQDGSFSFDALITRYNADLVNGYGNLVSRVLKPIADASGVIAPNDPFETRFWDPGEAQRFWGDYFFSDAAESNWASKNAFAVPGINLMRLAEQCIRLVLLEEAAALTASVSAIATFTRTVDQYISAKAPWKLSKSEIPSERIESERVLYTAAESIRIITALLHPILPFATARVWAQLGLGDIEAAAQRGDLRNLQWGGLQSGTRLGPLSSIFPRANKGLAQIMTDIESSNAPVTPGKDLTGVTAQHDGATGSASEFPEAPLTAVAVPGPSPSRFSNETTSSATETTLDPTHPAAPPRTGSLTEHDPITQVGGSASPTTELHKTPSHTQAPVSGPFNTPASAQPIDTSAPANTSPAPTATPQITIDDFAKVELRVAEILVCERIPKADKLLRLEVDLGPEPGLGRRQILSGIAEWYTPEDLIGRKIVVITNLAPRKMRGLESHGMLLAASTGENGKPALATFAESDNIEVGARLK